MSNKLKNEGLGKLVGKTIAVGIGGPEGTNFCLGVLRRVEDGVHGLGESMTWALEDVPQKIGQSPLRKFGYEIGEGVFFVTSDVHWWALLKETSEES